mmetsp:Transcript_67566/g.186706  ORF Transcript_67566/g.186706 Transcript_67566/m.186706 type:complete len:228 (+) Transcript_67566:621-1304(+)
MSCVSGVMWVPVMVFSRMSKSIIGRLSRMIPLASCNTRSSSSLSSIASFSNLTSSVRLARYMRRQLSRVSSGVGKNSLVPDAMAWSSSGTWSTISSPWRKLGSRNSAAMPGAAGDAAAAAATSSVSWRSIPTERRSCCPSVELPITAFESGTTSSSKPGIASFAGLLLKLISTFAARGVSGKRQVMNTCSSAPHEWPMPITGTLPYCLASGTAARSNRSRISSHSSR